MDTLDTTSSSEDPMYPSSVYELKQKIVDYLADRGVGHLCQVQVNKRGRFFELKGRVDSFWTRSVLFALVPKYRGQRYIIDKLRVVSLNNGSAFV